MTRTFTVANIQNVYTTTLLDQFRLLDAQRRFSPIQDVVIASIEVIGTINKELERRGTAWLIHGHPTKAFHSMKDAKTYRAELDAKDEDYLR